MVNGIEHLEQRVLLAAAEEVPREGALPADAESEGAAAVEATVGTHVVLRFVPEGGGGSDGVLRAVVTPQPEPEPATTPAINVGRVMFYRNGKPLTREGVPVTDGLAELPVVQQRGIYTFEARYEGDGVLLPSASGAIEADARAAGRISLANGVIYGKEGRALALKARLSYAVSSGFHTGGSVTFHDEAGRALASAKIVNGTASAFVTLPLGKYRLIAKYSGDKRYRPAESTTQTLRVYHRTSVDLMVAYTPAALQSMGGHRRVRREILRAVDAVNDVLRNSRVRVSVRLVAAVLVAYEETGDYERDLKRLADDGDGHMDLVPSQRHSYGADLVSLLVGRKGKGDVVGTAYRMTRAGRAGNERLAYSVVHAASAAGPNYTLAHELAHNFGAAHDEENAPPGRLAAPYAHGFKGFVKGEQVRDVMGYPPGKTLPYFSNPLINYRGTRIGDERRADVARLIGETAPLAAAYQDEKVRWGESLICTCW